ncbi:MAG: M1 family metallopeptidase [Bacteroidetes bacterium]|nr:M1 family metallopeptidase [Bacteroidota bacterium]
MFRPIEEAPDPNEFRSASGAPGARYWQQKVDYVIETRLDTVNHAVSGSEKITYHNNSPDVLPYVWIQLDQNVRSIQHSRSYETAQAVPENVPARFRQFFNPTPFDGGYTLSKVQVAGANGKMKDARHIINDTVMKVYLDSPLQPGESTQLGIDWSFPVPDDGRGAKELVSDGWLYEIAQWFPRLSVYDDINGWQTDQFMGRGEFYLEFGDYDVTITVPWNHIVGATGVLQNPDEVLTATQRKRLERALNSSEPVFIVEPDEVMTKAARPKNSGMLSWHFKAENVRDFAWVSSKTYVWDAMGYKYKPNDKPIQLNSIYPRDAMPLWDEVSTKAIAQTMETYGRMALQYPYPQATNVHGPVFGMEYPMIAFCGARPQPDGSYSEDLKRALISVTIHEVGHNWFPMIVASDERKWTWMDEGLNSFLQYYAEKDWDPEYPSRRGPARNIVGYMRSTEQVPLMTESDLIPGNTFGNNGYSKPAAGLVMLREQIIGSELFDEAFREYSHNWAFKHPQPHDFFRSMEEGAGENLAWFWRGWFYTTHYNDQAIDAVSVEPGDSVVTAADLGKYYYRVNVSNQGGLILPVQMEVTYDDGSSEMMSMPADIWRTNEKLFRKGFFSDKKVTRVELDPDAVLADINTDNNVWVAPELREAGDSSGDSDQ